MISNVYSYYLAEYGNKTNAKYDNHKKSDIKSTYNKVLKINSLAPSYKIDFSEDAQKYAIDLKESARDLTNIANDLSDDDSEQITFKKSAESQNPDIVDVEYIGDNHNAPVNSFEVHVAQLASSQVNTGNYLQPNSKHITPGEYSFDLTVSDLTYEFEFGVNTDETTKNIQEKISRLINRSNIGLNSSVLTDSLGNTALAIESEGTGVSGIQSTIFTVKPNTTSNPSSDIQANTSQTNDALATVSDPNDPVNVLGLNRTSQYPTNAVFSIDGNERTSYSNTFTINNAFELNFKQTTNEDSVAIRFRADGDAISDSINELISGYNSLVSITTDESNDKFSGNLRLKREFTSIAHAYGELLGKNGLEVGDDGSINIDKEAISNAANNGTIGDIFSSLGKFKNAIQSKAENIALNPMDYVNNKIVAYKNPLRTLTDPYNVSAYSGMMFSGYI